jgi:hypothetical protein
MLLRQSFEKNPEKTLQQLIDSLDLVLKDFPLSQESIISIS